MSRIQRAISHLAGTCQEPLKDHAGLRHRLRPMANPVLDVRIHLGQGFPHRWNLEDGIVPEPSIAAGRQSNFPLASALDRGDQTAWFCESNGAAEPGRPPLGRDILELSQEQVAPIAVAHAGSAESRGEYARPSSQYVYLEAGIIGQGELPERARHHFSLGPGVLLKRVAALRGNLDWPSPVERHEKRVKSL